MSPSRVDSGTSEKSGRRARNKNEASKIWVYETDSQQSRTIRREELRAISPGTSPVSGTFTSTNFGTVKAGTEPLFFEIPVPAGKRYLDITMPEDKDRGLGPSQIASVSVPWSVFVRTSLFKDPAVLYVTSRC